MQTTIQWENKKYNINTMVNKSLLHLTTLIPDLTCLVQLYAEFTGIERITIECNTFIHCFAIFPNGNVASGSSDALIKIWNPDGKCLKTLKGKRICICICI